MVLLASVAPIPTHNCNTGLPARSSTPCGHAADWLTKGRGSWFGLHVVVAIAIGVVIIIAVTALVVFFFVIVFVILVLKSFIMLPDRQFVSSKRLIPKIIENYFGAVKQCNPTSG